MRGRRIAASRIVTVALLLTLLPGGLLGPSRSLASTVGDRVVIEVNGSVFTQRQIELFTLFRSALSDPGKSPPPVVAGKDNWADIVRLFADEMIVLQEAQRSGSFLASGKTVDVAVALVKENIKRSPAASSRMESLRPESIEIARYVGWALRSEAYRRSKDRQLDQGSASATPVAEGSGADGKSSERKSGLTEGKSWKSELIDRAVVRHFDGSKQYIDISPAAKGQ